MSRKRLRDELKLSGPFANDGIEAYLNLVRSYEYLHSEASRRLKALGVSQPQYNVLRILRGAGEEGLSCREVGNRMVARVPDVTRLLDRLTNCGYVHRERSNRDARKMIARITPAGLEYVEKIIPDVDSLHLRQFEHMPADAIRRLSILLEQVRSRPDASNGIDGESQRGARLSTDGNLATSSDLGESHSTGNPSTDMNLDDIDHGVISGESGQ